MDLSSDKYRTHTNDSIVKMVPNMKDGPDDEVKIEQTTDEEEIKEDDKLLDLLF